ncbi:MAG: class I SAM-dependent methyltransferase [Draconibacterium sp.]
MNPISYKLEFYEKMLNFVRVVGLKALSQNLNVVPSSDSSKGLPANYGDRVSSSFVDFLFQFGIIVSREHGIVINNKYGNLLDEPTINNVIDKLEFPKRTVLSNQEIRTIDDFLFIIDLVRKYNDPDYLFQNIKKRGRFWESLLANKQLDYEVRLCETLFNLVDIKIPEKIISPFEEDYYTESGRNAFENYTRFSFPRYLKEIIKENAKLNVLDLGCGYGNYIELIHENFKGCRVVGIEKNANVYESTSKKFKNHTNVKIINKDFFDFKPGDKYDVILMNYVLFYFNAKEKRKVLKKAKSILNKNGSIILCQYIPAKEDLKKELAKRQNDFTISREIEMYYSDKILYANTLWNDAVDTFSEAVKWDELKATISSLNLEIASMTNADRFYYSLFIELKSI